MKKYFKIIDAHAHFEIKDQDMMSVKKAYTQEHGEDKWQLLQSKSDYLREIWRKSWGFEQALEPEDTVEKTAQLWLDDMDKKGVDKMIFATAGDYASTHENMKKVLSISKRFIGYAYIDPFEKGVAKKVDDLITNHDFKGVKILGPALDGALNDDVLKDLWEVCEKHTCPVLIHFGILGAAGGIASHVNISPMILHDVAKAYPSVPFIVPHFGCGQVDDALMLCWVCPNVYIDTSGSNQWTRWMPYSLTTKDLFRKYYETIGPKRIIFGTDGEWFPRGFVEEYYSQQMKDCLELGFSDEEIQDIFYNNIDRLIREVK